MFILQPLRESENPIEMYPSIGKTPTFTHLRAM